MGTDYTAAEREKILDYIAYILLTHGHGDYAAALARIRGNDGPKGEFSIKRAAYVLGVAVLQSDLKLDEETRAAMDLAVSLGQDRAVMHNRPPHATGRSQE